METNDERAAEAGALFYYRNKKWIGSFAAALGGLDTFVVAGGIGENAPVVRAHLRRVVPGSRKRDFAKRGVGGCDLTVGSRVTVRAICTNEEQVIAHSTFTLPSDTL